jgi:citrate lyase beta subunit
MEGKAVLFKRFADVDSIDIEVNTQDAQRFIDAVELLEPTFGGINLEDIAAPDCFIIEQTLKERMNIPVFHDDQHGTAIIAAAGLINACELTGKSLKDIKVVCNGAGAAAIACTELIKGMGVPHNNVIMCDRTGVIYQGRTEGMDQWKSAHAAKTTARTLAEAIVGADVFLGLSAANALSADMVKSMADQPIIFAMANPDPEISPPVARAARPDAILVPKVNSAADVAAYSAPLHEDTDLWAMIETGRSLFALESIAAAAATTQLTTFVMGTNDLAKETRARITPGREPFFAALSLAVAAARIHGLTILDGVHNDIEDQNSLEAVCRQGVDFGFDGKTLIHPKQIDLCNLVFSPAPAEVEFARAVIEHAFRAPDAAEVEAQHGEAQGVEGVMQIVDNLVVHRSAKLRMRMQHDRNRRIPVFLRVITAFKPAFGAGENHFGHRFACLFAVPRDILDKFARVT